MFWPVLAIFRLSQRNLRSYYKHVHARGVEISTYGPYQQKQKQESRQKQESSIKETVCIQRSKLPPNRLVGAISVISVIIRQFPPPDFPLSCVTVCYHISTGLQFVFDFFSKFSDKATRSHLFRMCWKEKFSPLNVRWVSCGLRLREK